MNKGELTGKIRELMRRHGRNFKEIAQQLTDEGITREDGAPWDRINLRSYVVRNIDSVTKSMVKTSPMPEGAKGRGIDSQEETAPEAQPVLPADSQEATMTLPVDVGTLLVDLYQAGVLQRLKDGAMAVEESRPMFKGRRKNTGVHVNEEILKRATEKQEREKARTGGSLSKLVELLLWKYVGSPADVLEHDSED